MRGESKLCAACRVEFEVVRQDGRGFQAGAVGRQFVDASDRVCQRGFGLDRRSEFCGKDLKMGEWVNTSDGDFYAPRTDRYGKCVEKVKCSCGRGACSCYDGRCAYCRRKKDVRGFKNWLYEEYDVKNGKCPCCKHRSACLLAEV